MRFGYFCLVSGMASLIATIWMLTNGTMFLHGFIVFLFLSLFGLYLVRRGRRLDAIQRWAKNNPEEAIKWLKSNEGGEKWQ